MSRIRRILFASDFSPASRLAFATALELARALKAELLLTHALAPIVPVDGLFTPYVDWDLFDKASREAAQTELDRLARAASKRGVRATTLVTKGYAADQIVRTARTRKAHLIVMGVHGRTGLSRLVMGSVATRVMIGASCPVMTVRAK